MSYKEKLAELKRVDRETYDLFLEDLMSIVYGDGGDCPDVDDPMLISRKTYINYVKQIGDL